MKLGTHWLSALIVGVGLSGGATLSATTEADADTILRKAGRFAMGGTGAGGAMSQGERALRKVLAQPDTVARLANVLPEASPAGQLYALLGLRERDRDAYKRALVVYGRRNATVETMRGCILQRESFSDLVKQIDHGDYDAALTRKWNETPL